MIKLFNKYKEVILYLFFGGCTTLVNIVSYFICTRAFHFGIMVSTVLAWCLAVIFAYVTNRKYVFKSGSSKVKSILIEMGAFFSCRLLTGFIDFGMMYVFVDLLKYNDLLIKILSNVFVIISNYAASRLLIFKQRD